MTIKKTSEFITNPLNPQKPPQPIKENYTFYGKGGNEVDESDAFAKTVSYQAADHFFLWFWKGELFDPYGNEILKRGDAMMARYVRVNRKTFEYYVKYLKSKNKAFYNLSRREKMRG